MKTIYFADDGTIFSDKKDCKIYEKQFDKMKREVHIYDKNLKEISFDDSDWEENIQFFQSETEESFDFLLEKFPYTIIYDEDSERTQIFFEEKKYNTYMTTKNYEKTFDTNYSMAKKFEKGE